MALKYFLTYLEEDLQLEFICPEYYVIHFVLETNNDINLLEEMQEWCNSEGIYMIGKLAYFYTFEDRFAFILRWL